MKPERLNGVSSVDTVGVKFILRALSYRNYRLFFAGQGVSLIGTWMQLVAVSWLVYRLTNSPLLLGVVAFASQIPVFILAPFGGVLADRFNRKEILIVTQILSMIQGFTLAILTLTGVVKVWQVIFLSTCLGLINGFDVPVRQAFVVDMVEKKEDLGNAIALNSSLFNIARFVGPATAGILIATVGEGICFLINGISFLAVIFALLAMRIKSRTIPTKTSRILNEIKEGFVYAFGFASIRYILLLITLISLMGMAYVVLMPVFAREILGGGPQTLGFLMGATGLGALAGAIFLASQKDVCGLERVVFQATLILGAGLMFFALSRIFWLSLLLIFCVGFGMMVQMASSNTVLQSLTDDDKRGRVMSFFTMSFMGMAPFSSLLAGSLASKIGAPATLFASGFLCTLGAIFFSRNISFCQPPITPKDA